METKPKDCEEYMTTKGRERRKEREISRRPGTGQLGRGSSAFTFPLLDRRQKGTIGAITCAQSVCRRVANLLRGSNSSSKTRYAEFCCLQHLQ